jgi:carbon-monoxide dehydrogenase small subunit
MKVNGREQAIGDPAQRLLDFLRNDLDLTGAKEGCGMGECGACTVLVDGDAACSCLVLVAQVANSDITTVEGLASDERLHPMQTAFVEHHASQCGFCTPGMVVSAAGLLAANHEPDDDEILEALEGNLCRCTGYAPILRAISALRTNDR